MARQRDMLIPLSERGPETLDCVLPLRLSNRMLPRVATEAIARALEETGLYVFRNVPPFVRRDLIVGWPITARSTITGTTGRGRGGTPNDGKRSRSIVVDARMLKSELPEDTAADFHLRLLGSILTTTKTGTPLTVRAEGLVLVPNQRLDS